MDTTDDNELILIGMFVGDDIYGVASYNTITKQFIIDENEIEETVNIYREENQ